jgi:spermidine/putrescine ABC transporter ATP-binding subunit
MRRLEEVNAMIAFPKGPSPGAVGKVLVELKSIGKTYPNGFQAIFPISLSIYEGEFLTLLGPSGCGKTTTLRMLGGFETPSEGRIELDGRDITNDPPNKRATNMVFQDYALFPHMTVAENVAFGPTTAGVSLVQIKADVEDMLTIVGLAHMSSRLPAQLSGGQRQRVALARALIQRPKLLLLDEPLGALDANLREQMQLELKDIQSRLGITFVLVTHDQQEALTMSDRVVIIDRGRVQQVGTPEELYEQPANEFVATFLGTTNVLQASVETSPEGRRTVSFGGVTLSIDAEAESGPARIGIRPERIVPARDPAEPNSFDAVVEKRVYHGKSGRLTVKTAGGEGLLLDLPIQDFTETRPGETLRLTIPPNAIRIFG